MPNEIRLMPPARSRSRSALDTLSGLASVVTSAPGTSPNSSPIASTTATRSAGGNSVGVPPPKKTDETGRSRSPEDPAGPAYLRNRGPGVRRARGARGRGGTAQLLGGVGVEVAVAAPDGAERHVHVEAERPPPRPASADSGSASSVGDRVTGGQCGGICPSSHPAPRDGRATSDRSDGHVQRDRSCSSSEPVTLPSCSEWPSAKTMSESRLTCARFVTLWS